MEAGDGEIRAIDREILNPASLSESVSHAEEDVALFFIFIFLNFTEV